MSYSSIHSIDTPPLPAEVARHTVEGLLAEQGGNRLGIYWISLLLALSCLASLPLVHFDVTTQAPGVFRPATESINLKSVHGGTIARLAVRDNEPVVVGQPLIYLSTGDLEGRLSYTRKQAQRTRDLIHDLTVLATVASIGRASTDEDLAMSTFEDALQVLSTGGVFRTTTIREELSQLALQLQAGRHSLARARAEFERVSTLASHGLATPRELDDATFSHNGSRTETRLLHQRFLTEWLSRLRAAQVTLDQLSTDSARLAEERAESIVRAPVSGTVHGLGGIANGTYIVAGQTLGSISPNDRLLVEVFVSPRDIGEVRHGQRVKLQVDAFPYTQWGMLDGLVWDVASDSFPRGPLAAGSAPSAPFRVLIKPTSTSLRKPTGATAQVLKGYTVNARFLVARRSLLELLHESVRDHLDPQAGKRS